MKSYTLTVKRTSRGDVYEEITFNSLEEFFEWAKRQEGVIVWECDTPPGVYLEIYDDYRE